MNLQELIDINKQYRRHYIPDIDGLIELDNIAKEVPTITSGSVLLPNCHKLVNTSTVQAPTSIINNTQSDYNSFMADSCPLIFKILDEVDGAVLGGGGALWAYMGYTTMPKDFDIFLYDSESDPANNKIKRVEKINAILKIIQDLKMPFTFELVKGVITISITTKESIDIQIILRDYFSISEILHSFDIPSCAIAYDGKKTYFTKLAEWSIINHLNIVIPEYRSATYEIRLKKYFDKGFGLVFLCLSNMDEPIIHLPNMDLTIHCTINEEKTIAIGNIKLPKLQIINSFIVNNCDIDYDTLQQKKKRTLSTTDIYELNCNQVFKKSMFLLYFYRKDKVLYRRTHTHCTFTDKLSISSLLPTSTYKKWLEKLLTNIVTNDGTKFILNESSLKYFIKNATNIENAVAATTTTATTATADSNEEIYLSIKAKLENDLEQINYRLESMDIKEFSAQVKLYKNEFKHLFDITLRHYEQIKNIHIDWCIYLNREIGLTGSLHVTAQTDAEWYGETYSSMRPNIYDKTELLKTMHYYIINSPVCNIICPLCLENINIILSKNIITLKCGHIYHKEKDIYCMPTDTWDCQGVLKWFKQSRACPECREDTPISTII